MTKSGAQLFKLQGQSVTYRVCCIREVFLTLVILKRQKMVSI